MDVVFRYYFFVFCTDPSGMFDERTPAGGIVVRAWRRKTARQRARQIARERYAQSQHDRVLVLLARRRIDRYHVELMDDAWRRWMDFKAKLRDRRAQVRQMNSTGDR